MEFLLIMGIGTLVAIWVVANQPKPRGHRRRRSEPEIISFKHKPANEPAWRGELGEVYSTDEFDYMRKMARHNENPRHWPAPFPPPPLKRPGYETEYN
jgi:hypothetical protein